MTTLRRLSFIVIQRATVQGCTLGTAESLTGGLIASSLAGVPGASKALLGGIVSYDSNVKKRLLAVEVTRGVVNAPCAVQMAVGARECLGADIVVSATGLAGPGGGTAQIPVGTVFLAVASVRTTRVEKYYFSGGRQAVRRKAVKAALQMVLAELTNEEGRYGEWSRKRRKRKKKLLRNR